MINAHFENIRSTIIKELGEAKESIQIAVAWFTNLELFECLCEKLDQGLQIDLIVIDDFINNGLYGLNFQKFIDKGGVLRYGNQESPMHHKFAILDNRILINGSYNWTYYAESKNEENIIILKENPNLISEFQNEYENLKSKLFPVKKAIKRDLIDLEFSNYFAINNYLGHDLFFKGKENQDLNSLEIAVRLSPNNEIFNREYKNITERKIIRKTTISIGVESRKNGVNGHFVVMIPKGSIVPFSHSQIFHTVHDNQTEIEVKTFKGENEKTSFNQLIGSIKIKDLPMKKAGQASVRETYSLDKNGKLTVIAENVHNGNSISAIYDLENMAF